MPHKIFEYNRIRIFFKHTDYYGFVHPYNYLEWMSYAREAFFQEMVPDFLGLCNAEIKMVTASTEFKLEGDAVFGDEVLIEIYAENVRRLSFDVIFWFRNGSKKTLIGMGRQRLTFLDAVQGRPAKIPEALKEAIVLFEKKRDPSVEVGAPGKGSVK